MSFINMNIITKDILPKPNFQGEIIYFYADNVHLFLLSL